MNGGQGPTSAGADRPASCQTASVRTDPLAVLGEDTVPACVQTEPCRRLVLLPCERHVASHDRGVGQAQGRRPVGPVGTHRHGRGDAVDLGRLPPGPVRLRIEAPGQAPHEVERVLRGGARTTWTVTLPER